MENRPIVKCIVKESCKDARRRSRKQRKTEITESTVQKEKEAEQYKAQRVGGKDKAM